ncbi:alpha-1,4-glucan--maltose-1-phosphate maltosyltransferase [Actinomadura scrupuli]|uniref:alpha-1,4-glucan--maltose-1-phosphate maltosyltransferase n=1 Tax=Actinomadura scrupuli TaxID=559629 RepID=UPI003D983D4C
MIGRIPILDVEPQVPCSNGVGALWPAKASAGETFEVSATVFREGHEMLGAGVVLRDPSGAPRPLVHMSERVPGTDRLGAEVTVGEPGLWHYRVEAWGDPIAHWRHDAEIKIPRGQDVDLMFKEGSLLFARAAKGATGKERSRLSRLSRDLIIKARPAADRLAAAGAPEITAALLRHPLRDLVTTTEWLPVMVHRERALYGSWYEFFPRSEGASYDPTARRPPQSGTFRTAMKRLPAVADMGFDVLYLPPIHPIGTTFRKGPNNTLNAGPDDPGVPWAIGSRDGGHDAVHPDLGTIEDFDAFVSYARDLGLEIALDLALQCSPDHPWVTEHPEWFSVRADGTIAYAENPPKKYQDIYPINFDRDPEGIYQEVLRVVRHWMDHGVRIFRVDNPHTKPVAFWERLLAEIARTDPDVLFLAEAFTRPAMMHTLGKIGFHQSYTYFTWRNSKDELEDYLRELSGDAAKYMRPNFFVNTPDILNEYLVHGGRPAFEIRAVLAAMLSPTWGVYSGYELIENIPVRPGSEEYRDSEKYQYRPRDWEKAEREGRSIAPLITRLNMLRRAHPALGKLRNLRFHHVDQPDMICFSKRVDPGGDAPADTVLIVVNLNPYQVREATVHLDLPALGVDPHHPEFAVTDELSGESYQWGQANYVRLDPHARPAHIFTLDRPGPTSPLRSSES